MNTSYTPDPDLETRLSRRLLDVLIRAGLILAMAVLCYQIFRRFSLWMVGANPGGDALSGASKARAQNGRQAGAGGDSAGADRPGADRSADEFADVRAGRPPVCRQRAHHTLQVPAPSPGVAEWPIVGKRSMAFGRRLMPICPHWCRACSRSSVSWLETALGMVASIGGALLLFLVAFIIAGIIMAFGESGARKRARFSIASSAPAAAKNLPSCPRRPFARGACRVCSAWPLSRPWSSACSC